MGNLQGVSNGKSRFVQCEGYGPDQLTDALERLLAPLGGITRYVRPGQKVLLKPNMLAASLPEEAVTTHPSLVACVVRAVIAAGGEALVGDSPGVGSMARVGKKRNPGSGGGSWRPDDRI